MIGCKRLEVTGSETSNYSIDATILDHVFMIDESLEFSDRNVYFTSSDDTEVISFLLYDNNTQKWFFSHSMDRNRFASDLLPHFITNI